DDNSQYVAAANIVPNTLTGNQMTVSGAQITVERTTPPSNTNVVKGASSVEALGVLMTAGTADDLKVTSLKLRVYASSTDITGTCLSSGCNTAGNTAVNTVAIYEEGGTTPLATKNLSDLSGTVGAGGYYYVQYTGLNYKVPAGSPKKLIVKLGLKESISAETWVMVDLDPDDDMDVETFADGKSVTENSTALINTSSPVDVDIATAGTITVAVDGTTPTADVVLSGSLNKTISIYKFTPTKESFTLTGAIVTASTGDADNISKVMVTYKNEAGVTVTKDCFLNASGECTFNDGQLDAYFPVNQTTLLTISANFATIDGGADSGDTVQLGLKKAATQFGASANLTNDFILLGKSSNTKLYGVTNSIALVDSSIANQTVRKTKVTVAESDSSGTSHTSKAQDPVGVFTFTSEPELNNSQNSTLSSVTLQLSGSLIAAAAAGQNDTVTVYAYNGNSFDSGHLMGSADITGLGTSSSTALTLTLSSYNEWNGIKQVYFVVDTTDADFSDAAATTEKLTLTLSNFGWGDGSATAINPVSGVPVYGDTYSY
ncbi:MAG: hypothetical protein WCV58_04645, partial [Patescibacteria group bacterium]